MKWGQLSQTIWEQPNWLFLDEWKQSIRYRLPKELQPNEWLDAEAGARIGTNLSNWAEQSSHPLVVFLDEIDALSNETLISVLRQIRSGFPNRPQGFPQSLALVGMRDVRDYKYASGGSVGASPAVGTRLNTSSPFNIKVRSFTLSNFTLEDVRNLYQQHTEATGQVFTAEAVDLAFHLTQGQPWLVNAIAKEIVEYIAKDPNIPITPELVSQAKEILITAICVQISGKKNPLNLPCKGRLEDQNRSLLDCNLL